MKRSGIAARFCRFRDFIKTPAGARDMLRKLRAAAETSGVEWCVAEQDGGCADPFAPFAASMNYLKENFVS